MIVEILNRSMDYFPPNNTKYIWNHKVLQNRPWWFQYTFKKNDTRSCVLEVNLTNKGYRGLVVFYNTSSIKTTSYTKFYKKPINAVKATETLGDFIIDREDRPYWADKALELGWRPPNGNLQ